MAYSGRSAQAAIFTRSIRLHSRSNKPYMVQAELSLGALSSFNRLKMPDPPQTTEISMEQKKKGSLSSKEPQTRAEHLRQSKGISLPKRIEAKRAGAGIVTRRGRKR